MREVPGRNALVEDARDLAEQLLAGTGDRWQHTRAVARTAADAAGAVPEADRPALVAAAWLHDIGYASALHRSGFHPLDAAWYLQDRGWPPLVVGLVAHHSGARFVAAVRDLAPLLEPFADRSSVEGPVTDALTYADQTTGPDGRAMDVEERMADMLRRHGPDSPNVRCHPERGPVLRAAVHATAERLRARG